MCFPAGYLWWTKGVGGGGLFKRIILLFWWAWHESQQLWLNGRQSHKKMNKNCSELKRITEVCIYKCTPWLSLYGFYSSHHHAPLSTTVASHASVTLHLTGGQQNASLYYSPCSFSTTVKPCLCRTELSSLPSLVSLRNSLPLSC